MLTLALTGSLSTRLRALACEADDDLRQILNSVAADLERRRTEKEKRDAMLAEVYRSATAEELATPSGVAYYLQRLRPADVGSAELPGLLAPVAEALGRLAQTSADVDRDGKPTPGRGPNALALNLAKSEITRAAAVCRSPSAGQASLFVDIALGLLRGLDAGQRPAVGSG